MSTALTHKQCDDTSLKDEVERHWREIVKHSYRFEQQQAEVCCVIMIFIIIIIIVIIMIIYGFNVA